MISTPPAIKKRGGGGPVRFQTLERTLSKNPMTDTRTDTDRRVLKTKAALRDAMLSLMAPRGWDAMTIQEICDAANVGRSTFYVHYRSKDELLSESLNDLRDRLCQHGAPSDGPGFPFLPGLLAHMAEQQAVFKAGIGRRSGQGVVRRFKEMVCQLVEQTLRERQHPADQCPWLARYLAGGIVEAMAWRADAPEAPPIQALERELNQLGAATLHACTAR